MSPERPIVAYFSMEIALEPAMPTYSGGLGVLAGDTIRSAADLQVPMVAVTLLHRKGYFNQKLDPSGWQTEAPAEWPAEKFCRELPTQANVLIEGREVLRSFTPLAPAQAKRTRVFTLAMAGMVHTINGQLFNMQRTDFTVPFGDMEIWEYRNASTELHPMHAHAALCQVLSHSSAASLPPEDTG